MPSNKNIAKRLAGSLESTGDPKMRANAASILTARGRTDGIDVAGPASMHAVRDLQAQIASRLEPRMDLLRQADLAEQLGSHFVASVLRAAYRQLHRAPATEAMIAGWQGDPAAAAMAMRLNAALHLLARRETSPALTALYQGRHNDFDRAVGVALASHDRLIVAAMQHPTQTNEVGRAAALLSAFLTIRQQSELPFDLLELGSSSGLNLNLGRYAYDLGGLQVGDPKSRVKIRPQWHGNSPSFGSQIAIRNARGVDLNPLDASDPATAERLMSYVWADQPVRRTRLAAAIRLARVCPPRIDRGNAVEWLAHQLQAPQDAGVARVVFHSMAIQYFSPEEKCTVSDMIEKWGAQATARRPLARVSFEWNGDRSVVELLLSTWPRGEMRLLARCEPYGAWIEWLD